MTQSLTPSKESAPPLWPVDQTAPVIVPVCPFPVTSAKDVPEPALKLYAATRPDGGGGVLLSTVTVTGAEVVELPAASLATARTVCWPAAAAVVSQEAAYGADVSAEPRFAPSTVNWTLVTPTLSEAVACSVTVPDTVAPPAGAVTATVGAVVSEVTVADASFEGGPTFPAASSAVTL